MITFYFASKYNKRTQLLPVASLVMMNGHQVQADWLMGCHHPGGIGEPKDWAGLDLADVDSCTHFVLFNLPEDEPEMSPGRHVEFGYALAKGKRCIVIGGGNSVFYTQAAEHYSTVDAFLKQYCPKGRLKEAV